MADQRGEVRAGQGRNCGWIRPGVRNLQDFKVGVFPQRQNRRILKSGGNMNPEELCAMNRYQQLDWLSDWYGLEVGDGFESDLILANMEVEGDPDAEYDYSNCDPEMWLECEDWA
jgi:hypothetical protein